jgi:guanidinopropionase
MATAEDEDRYVRDQMDVLYWWGIPTLFRAPHDPDPKNCDIALVGVPHSSGNGSTERDQHLGPRFVRHVSAHNRRYHKVFDFSPWETSRINDLGDVPFPEAMDNEKSVERISTFFRKIDAAKAKPVSFGGDHSITGAILQVIAGPKSNICHGRPASLVHFDAHIDAYETLPHWLGAKKSSAHWAAYLVRQGNVNPKSSIQIGIRGNPRSRGFLQPSYDLGYNVITMQEYRSRGAESCAELIANTVGDGPVYITFDLDSLDPSIAPGVSNLEIGEVGWSMDEALRLIRSLRGKNVIGGDVVCLMPTKDAPNNMTSMAAACIGYEIVSLISDQMRG